MSANVNVTAAQSFESEGSMLHAAAFFNPDPNVREQSKKEIRAQSPFTPDQWEQLDAAVKSTSSREELTANLPSSLEIDDWIEYANEVRPQHEVEPNAVDYLIGEGLSVSADLARYVYVTQQRGIYMEGETSMNGRARGREDAPAVGLDGIPLPIVHADYEIDSREFQNSQAYGTDDLDTTKAEEATRAVNRKEESILWDGLDMSIDTERGAFSIDGLNEDTDKTVGVSSNGWVNDAQEIISDLKSAHDNLEQQEGKEGKDAGPMPSELGAHLFVPRAMWGEVTREDYETEATDEPVLARIERKFPHLNLQPAPRLDSDSAIMMVNDSRYFQIVTAQGLTNTSWEVDGGMGLRNKVMASRIPYLKAQPDGIAGVARITGVDA